ncbi:MAG: homoaconitate hydratase [Thermoplasmata archaeon]|nr:homoaconitate hydratase [Thermoplasmata archaeon]
MRKSEADTVIENRRKLGRDVTVYDSTLREGEQMVGVRFTPEQKKIIASMLIEAGVPQIEAGFAAISDEERKAIKSIKSLGGGTDILSLSRAKKEDIDAAVSCDVDMVLIFIATSDLHMQKKLHMTENQVLDSISSSVEYAKSQGVKVGFSTEDTTRSRRDLLFKAYRSAADCGADRLGITDTVGCAGPGSIKELVTFLREISKLPVSVHLHNDFGLALANALTAVDSGARAVATTVCGFGERAGNVPLEQFVMAMKHLRGQDLGIRTEHLTPIARKVSEFSGVCISPIQPWVGENVFAHESGIHVAAVLTDPETYEYISPDEIGNSRRLVMGKHTGRAFISSRLKERGISASQEKLDAILKKVKNLGEKYGSVSDEDFWQVADEILKK